MIYDGSSKLMADVIVLKPTPPPHFPGGIAAESTAGLLAYQVLGKAAQKVAFPLRTL